MIRIPVSPGTKIGLGIASFVILAGIYTYLSHRQHVKNPRDTTIPSWSQLGEGIKKVVKPDDMEYHGRSWIWVDSKASFERLFSGLAIGILCSIVIGVAMGCFTPAEAFLLPPLSFLAKIPPTAMLAVFFVLVGTGEAMYVTMIAFGVLPTLAQAVYQAAKKDVPDELLYKAYTLGASHAELVWNVVYKQILPRILESVRLQIGPAMVYLIAAEWMNAELGFGYRLRFQSRLLQMNVVYVYLVYLGLIGLAIDWTLTYARRKICPWFGE